MAGKKWWYIFDGTKPAGKKWQEPGFFCSIFLAGKCNFPKKRIFVSDT